MANKSIEKKKQISQLIFMAVSVLFIIVFILKFGELSNTIELLWTGSWVFLLAVIGLQVLAIINKGAFYHSVYDYFGAKDTLRRLTFLALSSNFVISLRLQPVFPVWQSLYPRQSIKE